MPVSHSTPADGTFTNKGKVAWDADHALGTNLAFLDSMASANASGLRTLAGLEWIGSYTWANLPAASSNSGKTATVTDVGAEATFWQSNGTRWRLSGGASALKQLGAPVTGFTNAETIALQAFLPAGSWQTNDSVRLYFAPTKSGTTDSLILLIRIGTAGTTGDTVVVNGTIGGTSVISGGWFYDLKLLSATSVQKVGGPATVGSYAQSSNSAAAGAVTISSAVTNGIYVNLILRSSGTTNTVGIDAGRIELLTP